MYLLGHGSLEEIPSPLGTLGWEGQWDCDVSAGTWDSRGHPIVPRGLWDVLTGLRNSVGKSGQHLRDGGQGLGAVGGQKWTPIPVWPEI